MADQQLNYALKGDSSGATAAFKDVAAAIQRAEDKADKFTASVDKLKESTSRQIANMSRHSAEIERQVAGMGRQGSATSSLVSGMSSLSSSVTMVAGAFAAFGAMQVTGWIAEQATAAMVYGASIQDLSDRLGISTEKVQVFGAWAELSGTSTEAMAKAIAKLETNIAKGDKELANFGITALDGEAAFMQVVAAVEKAPNQFEKARIAEAAFGKSWAELMPVLNAGSASLKEMADNADLIDPASIKRMAELDDKVTEMKQSFRALGVEITAAFGPAFISTIDYATRKIRELHDTVADENTEGSIANIRKLGNDPRLEIMGWSAMNSGAKNRQIVESIAEMDRSNALMQKANEIAESQKAQRAAAERLEADRKKEADDKKAEAVRKAGLAELAFQKDMYNQLELLRATADQRELLALDQKYATLREKHKANKESILAIDLAHQAELQNFYMQQNFGRLSQERDADMAADPTAVSGGTQGGEIGYRFNSKYQYRARPNPSLGDAVTNAPDHLKEYWAKSGADGEMMVEQYKKYLEEMEEATDAFIDSVSGKFGNVLGDAIVDAFVAPSDAIQNLKESSLAVFEELSRQVASITAKWILLKVITGSIGGSAPVGLGEYLLKSLGGHADGTLSSPGGLKLLGERGPEPYETPYGQRGLATFGLYQVPAGTRVQSATSGASGGSKEYHLHTTEADPIQVGEIFRRVVREEIQLYDSGKYRGRVDT